MAASTAAAHDGDAVADAEQLGEIRADHEDRLPLPRQPHDLRVDVALAADVDAARRLVEQEDVGIVMEEPSHGDLLLIAAGEAHYARTWTIRLDAEALHDAVRLRVLRRTMDPAGRRARAEAAHRHVVGDGERQRQPFPLAVFAEIAESAAGMQFDPAARCSL